MNTPIKTIGDKVYFSMYTDKYLIECHEGACITVDYMEYINGVWNYKTNYLPDRFFPETAIVEMD